MKKIIIPVCLIVLAFIPWTLSAQTLDATPQPSLSDLQDQIQDLKEELNQVEISTQQAQGQASQVQKTTFGLAGGTFEQDFRSSNNSWSIEQGQTLDLKFFANPVDNVKAKLDLEFWGYVVNDLTQFEDIQNLADQNIFFTIKELDVTLDTGDFSFQAFKGLGTGGYGYSRDDFYSLFPDSWDVNKVFRYTGNSIPEGMSIKGEKDFDGLEIWAGPQLQWGASPEAYLMYQHKVGGTTLGIINRFEFPGLGQPTYGSNSLIPLPGEIADGSVTIVDAPALPVTTVETGGAPVTNAFATELTWKIPLGDSITWDNVGLYDPNHVNDPYTYVQNATSGPGTFGIAVSIVNATTTQTDALGYQTRLTFNMNSPVIDTLILNGEYSGILAGDRERIAGEISKVAFPNGLFTFDAIWQDPLIGPNPYLTDANGTAIITTRGQNDPFQVTSNPISGVNNREMTQFKFSFVFNPGAGWFFRYNPNDFGAYNVNTDLDTPFSFGVVGTMTNYPTGTDQYSYINNAGVVTWDGGYGQAPTNGYQPYIASWTMWKADNIHWVLDVEGGYSQSGLSYNDAAYPFTNSFQANLTTRINNTSLTLGYATDIYGPEDWLVQFGDLIGRQYLAQIAQKFGNSTISLKYEEWDQDTDPTQGGLPVTAILYSYTLPMKELYATYTLNF